MLVIIAGGEDVVRFFLSRGKGIHDFKEDQGGSVVTKIIQRGDLRKLNGNKLLMRGDHKNDSEP